SRSAPDAAAAEPEAARGLFPPGKAARPVACLQSSRGRVVVPRDDPFLCLHAGRHAGDGEAASALRVPRHRPRGLDTRGHLGAGCEEGQRDSLGRGTVKKRWLILAVIAALAAGGAVWASRRSTRVKPLVLSGSIEARDVEVGSLMGGRVTKVLVEEGATV